MGEDENIKADKDSGDENPKGIESKEENIKEDKVLIKTETNIRYKIGKKPINIPANSLIRCNKKIANEFINDKLAIPWDEEKLKVIEL